MQLHIPTILSVIAMVLGILACLFLVSWWSSRTNKWLLWWGIPFVMGAAAAVALTIDAVHPTWLFKRLGVFFILMAYGTAWQASRAFHNRRNKLHWATLLCASWVALSYLIAPLDISVYSKQIVMGYLSGAIVITFNIGMAREFSRSKDRLPSHKILLSLLNIFTVYYVGRTLLGPWLPAPLGALPTTAWSVATYNTAMLIQTLSMVMLITALSRERIAALNLRQAETDPLTGAFNRRRLSTQLHQLMNDSQRYNEPLSLLAFDLDNFKSINDRFGHQIGDKVIAIAAQAVRNSLRTNDQFYRVGGEEFLCLLPDTHPHEAAIVAERLRSLFETTAKRIGQLHVTATLSVGIATYSHKNRFNSEKLMAAADAALYKAKANGRNRVQIYG